MDRDFLNQIEEVALNAWPAPRQMLYDGWLLRFTGGSSKRVNSVNIRYDSSLPLLQKIRHCEVLYQHAQQPTLFRLPQPFTSRELDQVLSEQGYSSFDPTFVLGREIGSEIELPGNIVVREMSLEAWLSVRAKISETSLENLGFHESIIKIIVPEKVLLGLYVDGQPVACGMGVLEGLFLGFFGIYTQRTFRRCGYGRAVMTALENWGYKRGARFGYLQVEGHNDAALALYEKLGFKRRYRYSYSKKDS